ncbi:hypothetical protein KDA14_05705, partial [Candidatus Saccharibacteria bacterium]|nr:hypothetical protein [Candidatus Saccharibacteria bacterium]
MPIIGRQGGRRSINRNNVSNSGMAERANRRLNSVAENAAAKLEEALAVDGVSAYIWNKGKGSVACACRRVPGSYYGKEIYGENGEYTVDSQPTVINPIRTDTLTLDNVDDFFEALDSNKPSISKLKDKIRQPVNNDEPLIEVDDLNEDGTLPDAIFAQSDDFLNSVMVTCPVCYNSGYVDSWDIFGGQRFLFDFSGRYFVDIEGGEFDPRDSQHSVPSVTLDKKFKESITWYAEFPVTWK